LEQLSVPIRGEGDQQEQTGNVVASQWGAKLIREGPAPVLSRYLRPVVRRGHGVQVTSASKSSLCVFPDRKAGGSGGGSPQQWQ
jgi:hypothetical protein